MDPERWQRLKAIFEGALSREPARRSAFLAEACGSDIALRRELEALLAGCGEDDGFLERPAYREAPELLRNTAGERIFGQHLGPYSINARLGEGGMGVVYLARDTRLDRPVAIKALPSHWARDPQRRERLRREAKAAARLSHPGIATVYALEEFGDDLYIVYEYVPGHTLAQEIAGGPAAAPRLLDTAIQLARALAAAHEQGIVHRDLKPENVVRTAAGTIKILDFGLARFAGAEAGEAAAGARLTRSGTFMGTPAYASPEQLMASEIDFRTDIFSLGVLLYELASARHPFATSDPISTVARILEAEPADLTRENPGVPPEFARVIRRCLRKDPAERYASARDLLADLEPIGVGHVAALPPAGPHAGARPGRSTRLAPRWWWQFHQACAGFGYYAMLYPMWVAKKWTPGYQGAVFFYAALAAVMLAGNLRLHLWFTSRFYPSELGAQRRRAARWVRLGDWVFVLALAASALSIHSPHATMATLLLAVAVGSLVAFTLIEPTTARAAFGT